MRFYRRAVSYFRTDWHLIATLLVLVGLSIIIGLLEAWPVAVIVDGILTKTPKDDFFHRLFLAPLPESKLGQLIGVVLIGMGLKIAQDTIWMLRMMINNRIKYNGTARVRTQLFGKLQDLDGTYHRTRPQGDSLYRLGCDTFGLFGILDTIIGAAIAACYLVAMVWIMLSRNVWLAAYALAITPLLIWANHHFGRSIKARSVESKQVDADFNTATTRILTCLPLIQAFCRQRDSSRQFDGATDRSIKAWWRLNWQEQLYPWAIKMIDSLGGAVIFGYGGYLVLRDNFINPVPNGMQFGELLVFMAYLGKLCDPLKCLTGFYTNVQGHRAATERVFDVLDRESAVADVPNAGSLPLAPRTLSLRDVRFAYRAASPVLKGVEANVAPGEMVAFVGPSGTGKSTLLSLLLRFYNPTGGSIQLDGHDLRTTRLEDVRKHIAFVPQESPVFTATVAENIAFAHPAASRDDVEHAARLAGAYDFIIQLPHGFDTMLDDGGSNLSGGQRQRLAIARALLSNAPILVLDEPTSSLDPKQERLIMSTLRNLKGSRTIVLVTHRLDSLRDCDRIYVMDAGRVAQSGAHEELMQLDGFYRASLRSTPVMRETDSGLVAPAA